MANDVPKQLDASFTHHGMQVEFRARAPREARVLGIAMFMGMVLPMIPMLGLILGSMWWPEQAETVLGVAMAGVLLTLALQIVLGPALYGWAGKPALIQLTVEERGIHWTREGDRHRFHLDHVIDIEAMPGEIRIADREQAQRLPCAGLKKPAVQWLEARMVEAWERRQHAMEEDPLQRAERRKLGVLTEQG